MFDNLVTYYIHRHHPLPPNDALAYQYILAGNGLFIRAETHFFAATLPVASCTVRGLAIVRRQFYLKVPRIPGHLLELILTDARQARQSIGVQSGHGLNEVLYQFHHHGQRVQVKKPLQQATGISVVTTGHSTIDNESTLCDLHSHGNMAAFFSQTDDADEQGAKLYAVIGKLDTTPEIRLRVGLYGYWQPLPVTTVFTHSGPFQEPHLEGEIIMTTNSNPHANGYTNGNDHLPDEIPGGFFPQLEEPVQIKSFAVTYDRKFNCGNFESLAPAITIWVKTNVPEGDAFDLHHAKERVRRMARENVRAQWQRLQGKTDILFLGLQPPTSGEEDPIFIRTVSVSLVYRVNLGDYNSIAPGFTDWSDLRHVAHSPGELHMALTRMWQSLWANVEDEVSRAQGKGSTGGFFGLPEIAVEDLTKAPVNGRSLATNGSRP